VVKVERRTRWLFHFLIISIIYSFAVGVQMGLGLPDVRFFDQSLRFFGDLSGQKMGLNRTMSRPVFRPLLVICSGMCIQQPGETGSPQYIVLKFP